MQGIHNLKGLKFKLLMTLIILLVVTFTVYEYWLYYPTATYEEAIIKYCKAKSLTYLKQNIKIQETKILDSNLGQQFIVSGVTEKEFGSSISFFYLKQYSKGWKVVSAGTGP